MSFLVEDAISNFNKTRKNTKINKNYTLILLNEIYLKMKYKVMYQHPYFI